MDWWQDLRRFASILREESGLRSNLYFQHPPLSTIGSGLGGPDHGSLEFLYSPAITARIAVTLIWRRRRDSNPRDPFESNGFQDRRFQPLTHSSVSKYNLERILEDELVTLWGSIAAFWCTLSLNCHQNLRACSLHPSWNRDLDGRSASLL